MNQPAINKDQQILALLQTDDERAMELIFDSYYPYLVSTAYAILLDEHLAKDLVQDVLFGFWSKRDKLTITGGLKSYLRKAVVNRSIDKIRQKKRTGIAEEITDFNLSDAKASMQEEMEGRDLKQVIFAAIDSLPKKCKLIFSLSRFEDLSHKEIAEQLDISKKTIENQMTRALKTIRQAIQQYRDVSVFFIINLLANLIGGIVLFFVV